MFLLIRAGSSTPLNGVFSIDFPACLFSSGLTSNDSRCETPPHRKIQITDFARGAKCARPSGGVHVACTGAPFAFSPNNIAPSASPVKPIPVSNRNDLREIPGQHDDWRF